MKLDYELLDFGEGFKLERFGQNAIMRPDAAAASDTRLKRKDWVFQASCTRVGPGYQWEVKDDFVEPWIMSVDSLKFELRRSQSKNVGIFPEQEQNWHWLEETIKRANKPLKILNLFAYTGGATLVCAKNGAEVCHVDSAKSTVKWASQNAELSGLKEAKIRWIVDDARGFMLKEARRGNVYDGIILDPPPMGHAQGSRFEFRKDALELLDLCKTLLPKTPAFFLLNTYAMNLTPRQVGALVGPAIGLPLEVGELQIKEALSNRGLSCSVFGRFRAN